MLKKIMASLLSVVMLAGSSVNAFAAQRPTATEASQKIQSSYSDVNGTHYIMVPKSKDAQIDEIKSYLVKKYHLKSFNNIVFQSKPTSSSITPASVSQDKLGSVTKIVDLGKADGQPYAVTFANGGTIYWQDGGSTASVNVTISGQFFSVGVSIGSLAPSVTQYGMWCLPGEPTLLGVKKRIIFTSWHVYGWDELTNTQVDDNVVTTNTTDVYCYNCY